MKTFLEFMREDFSPEMQNWLKDNEMTRKMQSKEPKEPSKRRNVPKTVLPDSGSVDFTGSRHSAGSDDVKMIDPSLNQNWRSKKEGMKSYQQPPGFDTPRFEKARERMAAADTVGNEPPMPGAGPYKTRYNDSLKTSPIVPVPVPKPKAKPAEVDKMVPIPKMRPEKQGPLKRVEIQWPKKNTKQITDRVPPSKQFTDRVPSSKQITDRLPQDVTKTFDNTKRAVPIPKPSSTSLNFSKKKKAASSGGSFADVYRSKKEGEVFTWNNKKYKKVTKNAKLKEAATFPNTKYVPGLTQPGKQLEKRISDRVPETISKRITDRVPQEKPKPTVSPQKFYDVPAGTFRPQYELQKGDLGPKTMKRLSTEIPKGSSDAAYAAMIGSVLNRVGDKKFTSNKSIGQVFSDKTQFPKQPKTKTTPEFEKKMTSIATDVAAGKFPPVEKGADQWRSTSYLNTPKNQVWGKQGGKKVMGGKGKAAYRTAMAQNAPQVGKQTFIKTSSDKGSYDPYELPKMTKDKNTGVIRKAESGEPVLPDKGFASSRGIVKNTPSTVTSDSAPKAVSAAHKVRKGQSAEQIAKQYNLDLNKLEKLNPGIVKKSNKGKLFPGDTVKVK